MRTVRTELIVCETKPRIDLSESIARALRKDGEHVVHQDDSGRQLVAHVSNGAIVDWTALDEDRSEVATVDVRQPFPLPETAVNTPETAVNTPSARRPVRWAIVCACYESG